MAAILIFFAAHWCLSIFAQTFFLHRYAAHAMFKMSHTWERIFHFFTMVAQGPSFLNPYGYAILHRLHHVYSDSENDPHSPTKAKNPADMMFKTKHQYDDYAYDRVPAPAGFDIDIPRWNAIDHLGQNWFFRIGFGALYAFYYIYIIQVLGMAHWGWYFLLPMHWLMGPIHGAIVNWAGHMYGYVNFKSDDNSRNTLPIDFLTWGELYQNNHHTHPTSPNLAQKWWEIDLAYQVIRVLTWMGILKKNDSVKIWNELDKTSPIPGPRAA